MVVADHVQKVLKTNFAASWEEIGDEHELKDTYALSQMKSLGGRVTKCQPGVNRSDRSSYFNYLVYLQMQ